MLHPATHTHTHVLADTVVGWLGGGVASLRHRWCRNGLSNPQAPPGNSSDLHGVGLAWASGPCTVDALTMRITAYVYRCRRNTFSADVVRSQHSMLGCSCYFDPSLATAKQSYRHSAPHCLSRSVPLGATSLQTILLHRDNEP